MSEKNEFLTRKGKKTQQTIVDAAMALITTKGYSTTTMKDICSEAGVGVGTFYHYFQSKEEVLLTFIREENIELNDFYQETDKTSYGKAILEVMNFYLDLYFRKGARLVAQIYSTVFYSDGLNVASFMTNSFYEILKDALTKGQQSGEFTQLI
jgi:AcrR family transcriptional regulator